MDKIGLDGNTEYVAFDYWQNALVPPFKGRLQATVRGESCCVLAVKPVAIHPQLISTSRHITQGIVDVLDEKWHGGSKTLTGRSRIVGGDPYELRIVLPNNDWTASSVGASGGSKISFSQNDGLVRATILSPKSKEVNWTVRFK